MKKQILIKFASFVITVSIIIIGFFVIISNIPHYSYSKYGTYDNFAEYREDFEIVKNAVAANGNGTYYIKINRIDDSLHSYTITENTGITVIDIDNQNEINLPDNEKNSLAKILINAPSDDLVWIEVTDDYVYFYYDAKPAGIIYTNNIRKQVKEFEKRSIYDNEKYDYTKFDENWYGIYS